MEENLVALRIKIAILLLFVISSIAHSQQMTDCLKYDSSQIVSIVKSKGLIGENQCKDIRMPYCALSLDTIKCTWTMIAKNYATTRRGKCKHTNGCTIETTKTILVSSESGKIISHKKKKKIYPNYE